MTIGSVIAFTVEGVPIPQGSMRAFVIRSCSVCKGGNRAVITSDNTKLKQWRKTIHASALSAMGFEHPAGKNVPLRLEVKFFLPRAKSNKAMDAVKKPDLDKLIRAVKDAMTSVVYDDDSQIVEIHAFKAYGRPRVEIRVEEVGILAIPRQVEKITDADLPFATA